MTLSRIISGGQAGVDRGALDAALAAGFPCGGWCPKDRAADDGRLSERYPMDELAEGGYRQRTIKNLDDADGTAIIYFGSPRGGTELTLLKCIQRHKPYLLIDALEIPPARAAELLGAFIASRPIETLNVAGPSERRSPGAYAYTLTVVAGLLSRRHG